MSGESPVTIPIKRIDLVEALVALHDVQVEVLNELRVINAKLATMGESRSSVEIKTSTRGVDLTAKAYSGSDIGAPGRAALDEYARLWREVQQRQADGWAETLERVAAEKGAA